MPADHKAAAEKLADGLQARGLAMPAIVVLEILKPWRFVASQLLLMSQPLWGGDGRQVIGQYAAWLDAPGGIQAIQTALQQARANEAKSG